MVYTKLHKKRRVELINIPNAHILKTKFQDPFSVVENNTMCSFIKFTQFGFVLDYFLAHCISFRPGAVGGYFSDVTAEMAKYLGYSSIPQVAYASSDAMLSDKFVYPNLVRTGAPVSELVEVSMQMDSACLQGFIAAQKSVTVIDEALFI